MHIPDGFLDAKTWLGAAALSGATLYYGIKKTKERWQERQLPTLGAMSAFIFAAQMVNFPVAGGTSGHLLGAALATYFLGPWGAGLVLTTVLVIQALFFADGGITALGANVLNMAVIGPWVAQAIYRFVGYRHLSIFLAAWASIVAAALACSLELAFSGTVPLRIVLPAMLGWHSLIGIGEGLITCGVVIFLKRIGVVPFQTFTLEAGDR
ncbi:cobalt/nickel transport system permease protein [Thermanaeromonas toyohensis ToBE]|uniref:Cobalt/nickel transport system permease protein n=1 Tax=Thermanaeromonas toyohensis ToBE TaxID=698762 RepID=A0A1W1W0L7_9FIRM|nr:energy-coupling factor ABC transporter permease [Thermanaeromonas toyohensis]SMB98901.1 cobalt/nickel transport system permease protein [Thermanaeromonas toyohensis ToBE]